MGVRSLGQEDPWNRKMAIRSSIAWKLHGQRSLAGSSPQGLKELDVTEPVCTIVSRPLLCQSMSPLILGHSHFNSQFILMSCVWKPLMWVINNLDKRMLLA